MPEAVRLAKRIMIVDDHADTVLAMQRLLSRMGYDVRTADSFQKALEAAVEGPFDLLLADLILPDGDGLKLLAELQARGSPGVKGIALSGYGMPEDVERSRACGYKMHLTKPVQFDKLTSLIEKLLE